MSVEKVGPKGYEYQYSASLLIALEYLDKDNLEVYIEKENGEDAQIQFEDNDKKVIIDIQVKNRKESIDRKSFVKWLCHFDDRSSDKMLLNKLEESNNRFAVFMSNARCNDEISNFIDDSREFPLANSLNNNLLEEFRKEMYSCYKNNKGKLDKERNLYVQSYANKINNSKFKKVLQKIKVREMLTDEMIYNKMSFILNKTYHIPQSAIEQTILRLNELIKQGRDTEESITAKIRNIISEFSCETVLNKSKNYIIRAEKDKCKEILESNNVLLLTGVSMCGKTYLARDIAEEYLDKGYTVKIVGELQGEGGAFSFINNSSIEDRLLILDDPFGQIKTKDNSKEIQSNVEKLVSMNKVSRKIIITSRKDILLDTMRKGDINSCCINANNWMDITCNNDSKGRELWHSYYGISEEYDEIYDNLSKYLKKQEKESYLQLGHIDRIFKSQINIKQSTPEEMIKEARKDSQDLADVIYDRGDEARKIFSVLGITCNTYKPIQLKDLSFILESEDSNEYPGMSNKIKTGLSFSLSYKEQESAFPSYNKEYKLRNEYIKELKYLNKYGYIEIDKLKRIRFVHPIYQYAAKLLFKSEFEDIFTHDEVIQTVMKSCGSLSVDAGLCTVSVLEEIYIEETDEIDEIKKILLNSLNTIFLSVRDKLVMFLDKKINDLNEDQQQRFANILKDVNNINNGGVLWECGIPWFNPSENRGIESASYIYGGKTIVSNFYNLTAEQMWKVLNTRNTDTLQLNLLEKALEYDESFIRERAINLIFKNYAYDFNKVKLNNYLDEYEHSNFIYGLFTGALNSWLKYKESFRKSIVNYFKKSLGLMSLAIKARGILERFYEEYITDGIKWSNLNENDKKILWGVWHEVFIEYLNKFPSKYMLIDQGRMTRSINESLEYINSEQRVVELATAWFGWLNKYDEYNYTFDFGMSVATYLMDGTKENYEGRAKLFKDMLSVRKTKFITTNVKIFISNWNYLCVDEKNLVLDLISSDRIDIKWIQAVVLNIDDLCEEVQIKILGKTIEEFKIEEFIEKLVSKEILQECISMYCDYTYSGCDELWSKVIIEILKRDNFDRTFFIALKKVLNILYHKYDEILNDYEFYISLLNNEEKRKLIFNELLMMSINCGESNKKMWDLLLEYSSDNEKKEYFNKIVESVELIEVNHESYNGLYEVFSGSVIEKQIYSRLLNDKFFILMIESIKLVSDIFGDAQDTSLFLNDTIEKSNKQFEDRYMCELINNYKCNPPRLLLTDKIIKMELKELGIKSSELDTLMENKRKKYYEKVKNKTNYNEDYPLENWIE